MSGESRRIVGGLSGKASACLGIVVWLVAAPAAGRLRADDGKGGPLPPRALLRIGTDDLRTPELHHGDRVLARRPPRRRRGRQCPESAGRDLRRADRPAGQAARRARESGWAGSQSVAFSPDGTKLLWGEIGGEVALWDLSGDRLLFREKLHRSRVSNVAFSPDGRLMASARRGCRPPAASRKARGGRARLRARGRVLAPGDGLTHRRPPGPTFDGRERIACLAFTPDGTPAGGGNSGDATLFVWRIEDGRLLREIPDAHGRAAKRNSGNPSLNCVAVTPDGRRIMSVGQTTKLIEETKLKYGSKNVTMSEVRFWDIETGERVADYHGDEDYGFGYGALSRDGRRVAVGDFSRLRILDAATGQTERTIDLPGSWGQTAGVLARWDARRHADRQHDRALRGLDRAAAAPRREHARRLCRIRRVVAVGRSDRHRPRRRFRAGLGRRDRQADLAQAPGTRHQPERLERRSGLRELLARRQARRRGRPPGRSGRSTRTASSRSTRPTVAGRCARFLRKRSAGRRWRPTTGWSSSPPRTAATAIRTSSGSRSRRAGPDGPTPPRTSESVSIQWPACNSRRSSPWFQAALRGGNVIRFNALTGHEQRRFLADWRTPEQQKAGRPREPDMWEATFSADGRTLVSSQTEWIYVWDVESGTTAPEVPASAPARLQPHPRPRRPHAGDLGPPVRRRPRRGHDPPVRHRDRRAGPHTRARRRPGRRDGVLARRHQALHRIRPGLRHRLGRPASSGPCGRQGVRGDRGGVSDGQCPQQRLARWAMPHPTWFGRMASRVPQRPPGGDRPFALVGIAEDDVAGGQAAVDDVVADELPRRVFVPIR